MKKIAINYKGFKTNKGFTLIEILVVIGIIAILAAIVIIAINPARQFAQARNTQRVSNINAILNAVGQRIADNKGLLRDPLDTVCTAAMINITNLAQYISDSDLDMRPCLAPTYMSEISVDPGNSDVFLTAATTPHMSKTNPASDYYTGYTIKKDTTTQRITVCAPGSAEAALKILPADAICVTR